LGSVAFSVGAGLFVDVQCGQVCGSAWCIDAALPSLPGLPTTSFSPKFKVSATDCATLPTASSAFCMIVGCSAIVAECIREADYSSVLCIYIK
jgi:hypothetical protein